MKRAMVFVLLGFMTFVPFRAFAMEDFPTGPDEKLTPGTLCNENYRYRYPEHVPVCDRSVSVATKLGVFHAYMGLGYKINMRQRQNYKIDHLIPLCAGGGNDVENLWPEYVTLYEVLDPIEPAICDQMSLGHLKQKEAIDLILRAKRFPSEVPKLLQYVESL